MTIYIYNDCRYINPPAPGASAGTSADASLSSGWTRMMGAVEGVRALGATPGRGRKMAGFGAEKTGKMWEKLGKTWRFGGWFGFREEISGGLSGEWEVNRSWLFQYHFLTHKWWVWCGLKQCKKHVLVVLDHKPCQEFCHTQALGNACCFFLVKCMDFLFCP